MKELEPDNVTSQAMPTTAIKHGEDVKDYVGTLEPPRTLAFDELGLRLFGEIKWEVSEEMWDRCGWELSAIPWLAFVGCGGESLLPDVSYD